MTTACCAVVLDGDTEALGLLARGDASAERVCIERFGPLVWAIKGQVALGTSSAGSC